MKKIWLVLVAGLAATGCTTSNVVQSNTVAQKFAVFNKSGWIVTGGGITNQQALVRIPGASGMYRKATPPAFTLNPFNNAIWNTNFKVDAPNGAHIIAPPQNPNPLILSAPLTAGVNANQPTLAGHEGSLQLRN